MDYLQFADREKSRAPYPTGKDSRLSIWKQAQSLPYGRINYTGSKGQTNRSSQQCAPPAVFWIVVDIIYA